MKMGESPTGAVFRERSSTIVFKNMEALASAGFRYMCAKAGAVFRCVVGLQERERQGRRRTCKWL